MVLTGYFAMITGLFDLRDVISSSNWSIRFPSTSFISVPIGKVPAMDITLC